MAGLVIAFGLSSCGGSGPHQRAVPAIVAGIEQNGVGAVALAPVRGRVLLGELGCVACHDAGGARIEARRGPDLRTVGARLHGAYLQRFLESPHTTDAGTVMPDVLDERDGVPRARAGEALVHYLLSFSAHPSATQDATSSPASVDPSDTDAVARGRTLFREIGCVACHAPRDAKGNDVGMAASIGLGDLRVKYRAAGLRAFLLAPHEARPDLRMPDLGLSPAEAHDLGAYLLSNGSTVSEAPEFTPDEDTDEDKLATGRKLFAKRGCAHCHDLPDPLREAPVEASELRQLDTAGGCLSGERGAWPQYALTDSQRRDIRAALESVDTPLVGEARVQQLLLSRNCLACHQRGSLGGVSKLRNRFFTTNDRSVGEEGRLPPPLTGTGAKLQRAWLVDAIAHGQHVRPYLRTRMPGFGAAFAEKLTDALVEIDELDPIELRALPKEKKAAREIVELGRELVGDKGMNCISCHVFAGDKAGAIGGLDLVATTGQRLRPEWFAHFLRSPFTFKPGTLMPQFFPDGVSMRPEYFDGDPGRQIAAMWHYLAKGRNVRKPSGIRRPKIELRVTEEAVVLRRSVQNTGKRGISVGYPGGVNLTFDAERIGLNQIWWGKFLDAAPVWTGQGHGQARILGKRRVTLPNGPAFAALAVQGAAWPEQTRRELGHRWLGYDLDRAQRPSFRYEIEGIEITDTPREHRVDGRVGLRRVLRLRGSALAGEVTLQFRAAVDARIEDLGGGRVLVGKSLQMQVTPPALHIVDAGESRELRLELRVRPKETAQLRIDYRAVEEGK